MDSVPQRDATPLERIFRAAIAVVRGDRLVTPRLDDMRATGSPLFLLGAGKAALAMATPFHRGLGGPVVRALLITRDEEESLDPFVQMRGGHPVPDDRSERAGRAWLRFAAACPEMGTLVVLLSGGASALLSCPLPGIRQEDLAATTEALLRSGAEIHEQNTVRKHLAAVGGGRSLAATRARRIEVFLLSDVAGDRPAVIASGPFSEDPTTFADALAVLEVRGIRDVVPASVVAFLERGARAEIPETPKPGDPRFERVRTTLVGSLNDALAAADDAARAAGYCPVRVSGALRGEAREIGERLVALACGLRVKEPTCLVAGGEPTVTVRGGGRGGRCQELALAAAIALEGIPGIALLAGGSDGSDGPTPVSGAQVDGDTLARAREKGVDARAALAQNDSYGFFSEVGGQLFCAPTGTNVRDLVLVAIGPDRS